MAATEQELTEVVEGEGFAAGPLDAMGEGYGFRKIRPALGVNEMGINAIVMPPGYEASFHYHDEQEEIYICLDGKLRLTFGDGNAVVLGPGGVARVDASTHRRAGNPGDGDLTFVIVGAKGGYVGRDGRAPEGDATDGPPGAG